MTLSSLPDDLAAGVEPAEDDRASVLVVDDDRSVTDLYRSVLAAEHEVTVATGGEAALAAVDETVDVVLLDRLMPGMDGDEVLTELRDRGLDCRVAMVTAVEPDTDIIDMAFDDYLVKPVDPEALRATVRRLRLLDEREAIHLELSAKRVKRNVLATEKRPPELADSDQFQRLEERIAELEGALEAVEAELDDEYLAMPGVA